MEEDGDGRVGETFTSVRYWWTLICPTETLICPTEKEPWDLGEPYPI